jgi:Ca2+-transporting ATPase
MTVVKGLIASKEFDRHDYENNKFKDEFFATNKEFLPKILAFVSLNINVNTSANEEYTESGEFIFSGSKTDIALLNMTKALGYPYPEDREKTTSIEVYPFSSESKSMTTIIKVKKDTAFETKMNLPDLDPDSHFRFWLFTKGAAEIIFQSCTSYLTKKGLIEPITEEKRNQVLELMASYNAKALRTICVAMKPVIRNQTVTAESNEQQEVKCSELHDLIMVGLFGILDPLRPEVLGAVKTCQKAGITVRMVTGDSVATARAIAKDCGILTDDGVLLEGPVFRKLSDAEMDQKLPKLQVLARSSPLDKQILVGRLKKLGETVAVTGDGTNDGPALRSADIGFSMGIAGTEVAKESSDIVLLDDNFASLVKAVIWGRSVYDSVRKFLQFQLTVNIVRFFFKRFLFLNVFDF